MTVELITIPDVEILQAGTWDTSTGRFTWDADDLAAAVEAQDDPALRTPIIKVGHNDPRFDGEPTVGRIENLRVAANGTSLRGDFVGVPAWLAEVMPSAYPSRSVEGFFGLQTATGAKHRFVLSAVALLGVTIPAIESLDDVKALYEGELVAAGATAESTVTVIFKEGAVPRRVAASVSMETVRGAFYDALPEFSYAWIREMWSDFLIVENDEGELYQLPWSESNGEVTFGEPVEVVVQYVPAPPDAEDEEENNLAVLLARFRPTALACKEGAIASARFIRSTGRLTGPRHTVSASGPQGRPTNGGTMPLTPEQLTALGLSEDATPDQITEALVAAGEYAAAERDALRAQLDADDDTETPPVPELPDGVTVIDEGTLADLVAAAGEGRSANATLRRQARDTLMAEAVQAGKFAPARRAHFEALYEADPEGTSALVAKLAAGTVPTSEIGHAHGGADTDDDAFFDKVAGELPSVAAAAARQPVKQ